MPPVTSSVVGVLTACTTLPSSSSTASVLVPPTSMPIRLTRTPNSREYRAEIEVVAESAGADMVDSLRRQKDGRGWKGNHGDAHAVPDRLGAERIAGDRVENADQVRRHSQRLAVAPGNYPFVLKGEFEPPEAVFVQPFDDATAAQEALGGAARDIDDFAAEQLLAAGFVEDRGNRVFVAPHRLAHAAADPDRLGHREVDAPLLDLGAGARRFAGRGDRAHLDTDPATGALHPFPARDFGD